MGPNRSKTDRNDWKMRHQIYRVGKCRTGNCGTRKCRTGKCETNNAAVENAGSQNAGPILLYDWIEKKPQKCAMCRCEAYIILCCRLSIRLFCHCISAFNWYKIKVASGIGLVLYCNNTAN